MIYLIYFNDTHSPKVCCEIGVCASLLKEKYKDVVIENITDFNFESVLKEINSSSPILIVFFVREIFYDISRKFIQNLTNDLVHICIAYTLPTVHRERVLLDNERIDSIIYGEMENTLLELCECLYNGGTFDGCSGLIYRNKKQICINQPRVLEENLDRFPFADRDSFPLDNKIYYINGSRGCEGKCSFCETQREFNRESIHRFRSIKNIVSEIEYLVTHYKCKYIGFSDSSFCGTMKSENGYQRLQSLYEELQAKEWRVEFSFNLRTEQIDDQSIGLLKKLNRVGLGKVFIGIESFIPKDILLYRKMANVKDNYKAINLLKQSNDNHYSFLGFDYGFINFNPYTTFDDLYNNAYTLYKLELPITSSTLLRRVSLKYETLLYNKVLQDGYCDTDVFISKKAVKYTYKDNRIRDFYNSLAFEFEKVPVILYDNIYSLLNRYMYYSKNYQFGHELYAKYIKMEKIYSNYCYEIFLNAYNHFLGMKVVSNVKDEMIISLKHSEDDFKKSYNRMLAELMKLHEVQ